MIQYQTLLVVITQNVMAMLMRILIFMICLLVCQSAFSQSKEKKSKKNKDDRSFSHQPNTEPDFPTIEYTPKKSKKAKSNGPTYDAVKRYYARMEAVEKEKKKAEKEMMKPQYSEFSYFGHKRPPKKRKSGKMKFCKECGIRH